MLDLFYAWMALISLNCFIDRVFNSSGNERLDLFSVSSHGNGNAKK